MDLLHSIFWSRSLAFRAGCGVVLSMLLLAGCRRGEIQVYEVAGEKPTPTRAKSPEVLPQRDLGAGFPSLEWKTLPEGWQSQDLSTQAGASKMRAAAFTLQSAAVPGKTAEMSVIPIPGMRDNDLEFINMWRGQIGLEAVAQEALPKYVETVQIAGLNGKLFNVRGSEGAKASDPNGVLVAVLMREGVSWFFKLSGDEALVQSQRGPMTEFLKGVSFGATPAVASAPPVAPFASSSAADGSATAAGKPQWQVPATWQSAAPGAMLLAKFVASGEAGAKADITVSTFPGDVGGLLANINRWRGQLGLPALAQADLSQQTSSLDLGGMTGTVMDASGIDGKSSQNARMIGVVVPRQGQTWFYKLLGQPEIVEREKSAFFQFIQSVK